MNQRLHWLGQTETLIRRNTDALCEALWKDLRKPRQEAWVSEIAVILDEIKLVRKNLKRWIKPRRVRTPLTLWPGRSQIYPEPLGEVLVIGPWNYPLQLILSPAVGALAAGNRVVLKPSEYAPHTAELLAQLVERFFPPEMVRVVQGGVSETRALLQKKFDHIFFTGSTQVGALVMQAAAPHLTPVTLELGGKSPVIVCEDADLKLAARRITWGKCFNAGQTCVAPDYLYVHESVARPLTNEIRKCIREQFGENTKASADFARIITQHHCERIAKLIDPVKVVCGGEIDVAERFMAPTLLSQVSWEDAVMKEEIFGPVLPILTFSDWRSVVEQINSKPKPLAAYLFTRSKQWQKAFVTELRFGGGCINDVVVQVGSPHLPFGGVGASGMGRYHGEESFKTFSHFKSVITRGGWGDVSARYAPYSAGKLKFIQKLFNI